MLAEVEAAVAAVAEVARAAVVRVGAGGGRGAGFVFAAGRVVTNAHNLRGAETTLTFADGRALRAGVLAADVDADLAVLEGDTGGAVPLAWAEAPPRLGMPVFALAPGRGGVRVSFGLVSALDQAFRGPRGRRIPAAVEHTAPLARGSSGGPLVDAGGRLVGVNTNRLGEGFYLALPADAALRERLDALARGEARRARYLGVALAPAVAARRLRRAVGLPERDGLLVQEVAEGSPAAEAGLRQGDLLVRAGGSDVRTADDLFAALDTAGDELVLGVVRGVEELDVRVRLGSPG